MNRITVAALAEAKKLPETFLRSLGLAELPEGGVAIPYRAEDGEEMFVRRRVRLDGKKHTFQPAGVHLAAYGLERLHQAKSAADFLVLVEGESDAWTLWHHGFPCLGLPGSGAANTLRGEFLEGLSRVYVVQEPGDSGQQFTVGVARRLRDIGFKGGARVLRCLNAIKDPSDLHISDPVVFPSAFRAMIHNATLLTIPEGRPDGRPSSNGHSAKPKKPPPRPFPPYQPFPLAALPPTFRDYADAAAAAIGCDVALVAIPALAVAAGCIGNSRAIRLKRGWTEPAIIWSLTVAPSGMQKSPAWAAAVDPLMGIQMELIDARPDDAPCHVTSDATIQAVGEILRDNPRGLLLARDELDAWLISHTQYQQGGGTDRPCWLEMHRGGTLRVHRITRARGALSVRRACCSICGTIQPLMLARALDDEALAAGLAARLLLAAPPARRKRWTEAEVSEDLASRYSQLLRDLLALEMANTDRRRPHVLSLSTPAKRAWVEWYDRWAERQYDSRDEQAALLAKVEGYAVRLALLHHVITAAAAGITPRVHFTGEGGFHMEQNDLLPIDETSLLAGITLAEWFCEEALRLYRVLRETESEREQRSLLEWIGGHGGETTAGALRDSCRGRYPTAPDAEAALDALCEAECGEWMWQPAGPQGGRPTRVFRLAAPETSKNC